MSLIEETQTYSVWQRRTVPTIRINSTTAENGARLTLQEVINEAPHYAKIVLTSGLQFLEQIIVSRPIELCGEDGEEPCLTSRGPTITISADIPCFFSGIKVRVRTLNATTSTSRMEPPAVLVTSGRPVFFRCDLSSFCAAGTSQPVVERCSIQGNQGGSGLVVRDGASGTYLANEITNHTGFCIECTSRGSPKFTNNEVYAENDPKSGANAGIGVLRIGGALGIAHSSSSHDNSEIIFSGNRFLDIFSDIQKQAANDFFGADKNRWVFSQDINSQRKTVVIENASPVLVDNIVEGGIVGMSLSNCGGTFMNNIISSSILCAVVFMKGTQAVLESHKIANHLGGGVFIDGCSPTLRGCVIQQCKGVGVSVNSSMNFNLSKCFIEKNRCGVSIIGNSSGLITDCEVCRNDFFGIRVSDPGCRTRIQQNIVFNNGGAGVYAINFSVPRISLNGIHGQRVGILAISGSDPTVTENEIQGNDELAISIAGGAKGTYKQNKMSGGSIAVVRVAERCNPHFDGNELVDGTVGFLLTNKAIGTYTNNNVRRLSDGFSISHFADPIISGNQIVECSRYGVFVVHDAMGTITGNTIRLSVIGIAAFKGARATFRANTIERCVKMGAVLGDGCRVLVEKNNFSDHDEHGMVLTGRDCLPICRNNIFTGCKGFGCLSENGAEGVVSGSFFSGNYVAGFGTEDGGLTQFRNNKSIEDRGPAILCLNKGFGSFYDCVCEDGHNSGCILRDGARPILYNCVFKNFVGDGIQVCESAHGEVIQCTVRENRKCGISFTGVCSTVVDQLFSENNKEDGVLMCKLAASKLTKSTISGHGIGVRLQAAGDCVLSGCTITGNQRGVVVMDSGTATVVDSVIANSKDAHIELTEKGHATIKNCTLTDSGKNGIHARNFCRGIIEGTKILRCAGIGFLVEGGGDPRVVKCDISECQIGLSTTDKALGVFTDTNITFNKEANVLVASQSKPVVTRCLIARCRSGPGVTCKADESRFTDCQVQLNATYGFYLAEKCRAIVKSTMVQGNSKTGVYCIKQSEPIFNHCKIGENHQSGVILATLASPTFTENDISDNLDAGVICALNSQGIFSKNSIMRNNIANVRVFSGCTTVFTSNTIQQGRNIGVITQGGSARFEENHITQNTNTAVLVIGPSNVLFIKNAIQSNNIGVVLEAEGKNPVPDPTGVDPTTIIQTQVAAAPVRRRVRGVIAGPVQPVKAVEVAKGSSVTLEANIFSANNVAGVQLHRGANPSIVKNQFCDGDTGVMIFSLAQGIVESNIFMAHRLCAMEVTGPSISTKIRLNLFDQNEIGVLIKSNTAGARRGSRPSSARSDRGTAGPPRVNILDALDKIADGDEMGSMYGDSEANRSSSSSSDNESDAGGLGVQLDSTGAVLGQAIIAVVTISKNTFLRNRRHGVYLTDHSESKILANVFQAELCGIGGTTSASPTIQENVFSRCCVGVHSGLTTNFLVEKNTFSDETEIGVFCNGGTGLVTCNLFMNCVVAGVCSEGAGCPSVSQNLFAHNNFSPWSCGIYMRKGGSGYFTDNDLHENSIGARCDNNGVGSITNNFFHDNGYGALIASGGMCTISTCFFCCNNIADVCSTFGGKPNVSRCVMHDTAKPILITMYGGGSFTFNIMKNVDGPALSLMLPLPKDDRVARTKPKGVHERLVDTNGDVMDRDAVMYLLTLEEITGRIAIRAIPTVSSNLIAQCSIGIEVDCGAQVKARHKKEDEKGKSTHSKAAEEPEKRRANRAAIYESHLPNLATLQREEYWAIFTRNLVTQCVCAVSVAKGPVEKPPRFIPSTDLVFDDTVVDPDSEEAQTLSESRTTRHVIMQAEDDIRMAYFEDNTFVLNETGVQLKQGGNARFDRCHISRCTKFGVAVLDEGRGEFFENLITECAGFGVYVQGDPKGKGQCEPSWLNIQDCLISHVRMGINAAGGEPRIAYNRICQCDTGVSVGPFVAGLMLSNFLHECKKTAGQCYSDVFAFQNNTFFSSLELGAFEMKIEFVKLPQGNIVRNQFTPRIARADPAQRVNLLGEQVNEATSAKEQKDLFSTLKEMHTNQLPGSEIGGCARLGVAPNPTGSTSSGATQEMVQAARRKSMQAAVAPPGTKIFGANAVAMSDTLARSSAATHHDGDVGVPMSRQKSIHAIVGRNSHDDDEDGMPSGSTSYNYGGGGGGGALFGGEGNKWGVVTSFQPSVVSMTANNKSWANAGVKMGKQDTSGGAAKKGPVVQLRKAVAVEVPVVKPKRKKAAKRRDSDDDDDDDDAPKKGKKSQKVKAEPKIPGAKPTSVAKAPSPDKDSQSPSPTKKASPSPDKATRGASFRKPKEPSPKAREPSPPPLPEPDDAAPLLAVDEDAAPTAQLHVQDMHFPLGSRPASEHPGSRASRQSSHSSQTRVGSSGEFRIIDDADPDGFSPPRGDDQELFASSVRSDKGDLVSRASSRGSAGRLSVDELTEEARQASLDASQPASSTAAAPPPRKPSPVLIKRKLTGTPKRLVSKKQLLPVEPAPAEASAPPAAARGRRAERQSRISILEEGESGFDPTSFRKSKRRGSGDEDGEGDDQDDDAHSTKLTAMTFDVPYAGVTDGAEADDSDTEADPRKQPEPPTEVPNSQEASVRSDGALKESPQRDATAVEQTPGDTAEGAASSSSEQQDRDPKDQTEVLLTWQPPSTKLLPPGCHRWREEQEKERGTSRRRAVVHTNGIDVEHLHGTNDEDDAMDFEDESARAVIAQPIGPNMFARRYMLQQAALQNGSLLAAAIPKGKRSDDEYISLIVNFTKGITVPSTHHGCSHGPVGAHHARASTEMGSPNRFTFFQGDASSPHNRKSSQAPVHSHHHHHHHSDDDDAVNHDNDDAGDDDDDAHTIGAFPELSLSRTFATKRVSKNVVHLGFDASHAPKPMSLEAPATKQQGTPEPPVSQKTQGSQQRPRSSNLTAILFDPGVDLPSTSWTPAYKNVMQSLLEKRGALQEAWRAGPRAGPFIPIVPSATDLPPVPPGTTTTATSSSSSSSTVGSVTSPHGLSSTAASAVLTPPSLALLPPAMSPRLGVSPLPPFASGAFDGMGMGQQQQHAFTSRAHSAKLDLFVVGRSRPDTAASSCGSAMFHFDTSLHPRQHPTALGGAAAASSSAAVRQQSLYGANHTALMLAAKTFVQAVPQAVALQDIRNRGSTLEPSARLISGEEFSMCLPQATAMISVSQPVEPSAAAASRMPFARPAGGGGGGGGGHPSPLPPVPLPPASVSPVTYSLPMQVPSRPSSVAIGGTPQLRLQRGGAAGGPPMPPPSASGGRCGTAALCPMPQASVGSSSHVIFGDVGTAQTTRRRYRSHTVDETAGAQQQRAPAVAGGGGRATPAGGAYGRATPAVVVVAGEGGAPTHHHQQQQQQQHAVHVSQPHLLGGSAAGALHYGAAGQHCRSVTPARSIPLPQLVKRGAGESLIPYGSVM